MNTATLPEAQSTTGGCAAHYAVTVATPRSPVIVQCYQDSDGSWAYAVPSHSRPGVTHIVTVERNLFPLRGTCSCPARKPCRHYTIANAAANTLGEALHYIAKLRTPGASTDDWAWADELEARLLPAPQRQTEIGVAA